MIGITDVDRLILLELSDTDLVSMTTVNKYSDSLIDENFWRMRFFNTYGTVLTKYGLSHRTMYIEFKDNGIDGIAAYSVYNEYYDLLLSILNRVKSRRELLTYAAREGKLEAVKILTSVPIVGVETSFKEESPLRASSFRGHVDVMKYLLSKAPMYEEAKNYAMKYIIYGGHYHILVEYLHTITRPDILNLALVRTSKDNYIKVVNCLVDSGYPLQYDQALIFAASNGSLEAVISLFKRTNVHTNEDEPLRIASCSGYGDVVRALLSAGANPRARRDESIQEAAARGYTDIVRDLLHHGADPKANDNYSLISAAGNGHIDVVKLLIDVGVDVQARNNDAVLKATQRNDINMVKLLLNNGATVSKRMIEFCEIMGFHELALRVVQCAPQALPWDTCRGLEGL